MGWSGENGDPDLDDLMDKMTTLDYYPALFEFVYGDPEITEDRMQRAMAQFIRSIQSFDSKYDEGRALVPNDGAPFPNFTMQENQGKALFLAPADFDLLGNRIGGGAGCQGCHRAPEFDIDPNSKNNGVIGAIGGGVDLTNTRSPSLRNVVGPNGQSNGGFMHNSLSGSAGNLMAVINHYDQIVVPPVNEGIIDPRLTPGGNPQNLQLTLAEKNALAAFLNTLTGSDIYTNEKWSDPFDEFGELEIIPLCETSTTVIEVSICPDESFEGYSETGIYTDIFTDQYGCDSVRVLDLIVLSSDDPECLTIDVVEQLDRILVRLPKSISGCSASAWQYNWHCSASPDGWNGAYSSANRRQY